MPKTKFRTPSTPQISFLCFCFKNNHWPKTRREEFDLRADASVTTSFGVRPVYEREWDGRGIRADAKSNKLRTSLSHPQCFQGTVVMCQVCCYAFDHDRPKTVAVGISLSAQRGTLQCMCLCVCVCVHLPRSSDLSLCPDWSIASKSSCPPSSEIWHLCKTRDDTRFSDISFASD